MLQYYLDQAGSDTGNYRINLTTDYAQDRVESLVDLPLAGAPIGIKDIINVQ